MKHNEGALFLIEGSDFQAVLVEDDKVVLPLILEETGVDLFDHDVGCVNAMVLFLSWESWTLPSDA